MMDALYSAATGMTAQQTHMDVIANNLANVNTTAFKSTRLTFNDLLYTQIGPRQGARGPSVDSGGSVGTQIGMGVSPATTQRIFTQGDLKDTGTDTNMAIEGDGFFQVVMPSGQIAYTRDGDFNRDGNGQLVTQSGYRLEPSVVVPMETETGSLKVSASGRVTGVINGQLTVLGQIDIATFANPPGLDPLGNNTFAATLNSGQPQVGTAGTNGLGYIRQGFIEGSNVTVMDQMVDMITAQRAFESVAKVLSTSDEMLGMANQLRR
jgi:flagellar basal-body rod protein FlgG